MFEELIPPQLDSQNSSFQETRFTSRLPSIWEGGYHLLFKEFDLSFGIGMTGEAAISSERALILTDLIRFILPGMKALGIEGIAKPVTPDLLSKTLKHPIPFLKFEGKPFESLNRSLDPNILTTPIPTLQERKQILKRQCILTKIEGATLFWTEFSSSERIEATGEAFEFCSLFNVAILLKKSPKKGSIVSNREEAILRWASFGMAYSDRSTPQVGEIIESLLCASSFFDDMAGNRKDWLSNRWRRASHSFYIGDAERAWELIFETALKILELPDRLFNLLNSPLEFTLHPAEKRELIYFARAATSSLRLFALRRLSLETHDKEVVKTLESLVYCDDVLVRATATRLLGR